MTAEHPRINWYVPEVNERRASLRYRCVYPMRELRKRGWQVGFFDPSSSNKIDVLVLDAWTLFPSTAGPAAAGSLHRVLAGARRAGCRVLLDNCDNQFSGMPNAAWEAACEQLRRLAGNVDAVSVCSEPLAKVMTQRCDLLSSPYVVGDPIEDDIVYEGDNWVKTVLSPHRMRAKWRLHRHGRWLSSMRAQGRMALVWFGSSGNGFAAGGLSELKSVIPVLRQVNRRYPVCLSVISNSPPRFAETFADSGLQVQYLEWDRTTFLRALRLHDIAIIPAAINEFTVCKSANRLTLSMHHGLNVVCDAIPSYRAYAECCVLNDWEQGLTRYLSEPTLRAEHLRRGRILVEHACSVAAIGSEWASVFSRCIATPPR